MGKMQMQSGWLWPALAVALCACGPALAKNDLDLLEASNKDLMALNQSEKMVPALEKLLSEVDLGHSQKCRDQLGRLAVAGPESRSSLAFEAAKDCSVDCPADFAGLASKSEDERWRSVLSECPAGPLGATSLAHAMTVPEYALLRKLLVVDLEEAVAKEGSARAKAVLGQYQALLAQLARQK